MTAKVCRIWRDTAIRLLETSSIRRKSAGKSTESELKHEFFLRVFFILIPFKRLTTPATGEYSYRVIFESELQAAGILEPELRRSFTLCKRLNAEHGKTYYLATLLLPKAKRPYVHALYGFARYADEIVDNFDEHLTVAERERLLTEFATEILSDLKRGTSNHPVGAALIHTVNTFAIPLEYFQAFLDSMAMDLTVTTYQDYPALERYMYGSASVIGLQMLPILGSRSEEAKIAAQRLGEAFQLANFIRDIAEDIDRGRIYLPLEDLAKCGVTPEDLRARVLTPAITTALKFQIARVRSLQSEANAGIELLDPVSRPCIRAASELYCGIVDEIERLDYQIFRRRAKTSTWRRLRVALPAAKQALWARIRY